MKRAYQFFMLILFAVTSLAATEILYNTPLAGDPIQARIYRLDNGLTVCLSVNREAPNIQTFFGFRTGSLQDPADKTGLAHYLEHLLFKGSERLGTADFAKEQPLLKQIEALYERHEAATDPEERLSIYREIDKLASEAGQYTIQNEFVQAINGMGGDRLNAYTGPDRTVYLNSLPANQLEKFIRLQFDRFKSPVFRGFHTELETVFEEYNMYQDRPGPRFNQMMLSKLFPGHPYGRPVIGLPEHLKNPSPRRVKEFYDQWYVPGNMVIVLAGDLDPARTLRWIEETFGTLPARKVPEYKFPALPPVKGESVYTMTTPENEFCYIAWRFDNPDQHQLDLLSITAQVLFNGSAGLLDQDLNIPQKVTRSSAGGDGKAGLFGMLFLTAVPSRNSTPEEAKTLLDAEITKLKNGDFPDWLIPAITGHLELNQSRSLKDNNFRANQLLGSFIDGIAWPDTVNELDRLKKVTKQQVVDFARQHLTADRLIFYRKNGPLAPAEKLSKPPLTPLTNTAKGHSAFFREINAIETAEIQPEFPDLVKGINRDELRFTAELNYEGQAVRAARRAELEWIPNPRNDYFQLSYVIPVGSRHNRLLQLVNGYSNVAGTGKMSGEVLKQELFKLTGSVSISSGAEKTVVSISGLRRNLPAIAKLADQMLTAPAESPEALQGLVAKILLERKVQKENPNAILFQGLAPYVRYGKDYMEEFTLSSDELNRATAKEVAALIKELKSYPVRIQYFGPAPGGSVAELKQNLAALLPLPLPEKRPPIPLMPAEEMITRPAVYLVDVPNISQLHLLYLTSGRLYNPSDIGVRMLFNEYYGSGMSSVTFQKLRESNSLAYSCVSYYGTPELPAMHHYFFTYLSTQLDKLPDAMTAVNNLGFPVNLTAIENSRESLLKSQAAERWLDERLFSLAETYRTMGLPLDYRKQTYRMLQDASVFDLLEFYRQEIDGRPRALLVVGDASKIDLKALERFGPIHRLSVDDIFPR